MAHAHTGRAAVQGQRIICADIEAQSLTPAIPALWQHPSGEPRTVKSEDYCQALCDEAPGCFSFTYFSVGGKCTLRREVLARGHAYIERPAGTDQFLDPVSHFKVRCDAADAAGSWRWEEQRRQLVVELKELRAASSSPSNGRGLVEEAVKNVNDDK